MKKIKIWAYVAYPLLGKVLLENYNLKNVDLNIKCEGQGFFSNGDGPGGEEVQQLINSFMQRNTCEQRQKLVDFTSENSCAVLIINADLGSICKSPTVTLGGHVFGGYEQIRRLCSHPAYKKSRITTERIYNCKLELPYKVLEEHIVKYIKYLFHSVDLCTVINRIYYAANEEEIVVKLMNLHNKLYNIIECGTRNTAVLQTWLQELFALIGKPYGLGERYFLNIGWVENTPVLCIFSSFTESNLISKISGVNLRLIDLIQKARTYKCGWENMQILALTHTTTYNSIALRSTKPTLTRYPSKIH